MNRWTQKNGIPIVTHPKYYPANPSLAHRLLIAAIDDVGYDHEFIHDYVLRSQDTVWVREANIEDPKVVADNAKESGLDGDRLLQMVESQDVLEREQALTCEAVERQFFGAPTYVFQDEPFWGQDRIDMLDDVIQGGRRPMPYTGAQA